MATCIRPELAPSTAYKQGCKCERCKSWKRDASQRTDNKELAKERARIWRLNNLDKSRQNSKNYQKNNPDKVFQFQLNKYNISVEDYNLLLIKQNYVCAICHKQCIYKPRLSVDHCHETGKIRGLLCGNCNTGLGKFKESKDIMLSAIRYLEENGDVYP